LKTWAATVAHAEAGTRLDRWLAGGLSDLSRTRLRALIEGGQVRVGGHAVKAAHRLRAGERVEVLIPPPPLETMAPEAIPLRIVLEDEDVLVVDKPAGMVTHPGAGQRTGTLAAAALAHAPGIAGVGGPRRPGIVHRLDKGTSGLIVLAKTQRAYEALTAQLAPARLSVVAQAAAAIVAGLAAGRGIAVDVMPPAAELTVACDTPLLQRAMEK